MGNQIEFTVTIEVPDNTELNSEDVQKEEEKYAKILSDMEDVAAKEYSIYNTDWEYLD